MAIMRCGGDISIFTPENGHKKPSHECAERKRRRSGEREGRGALFSNWSTTKRRWLGNCNLKKENVIPFTQRPVGQAFLGRLEAASNMSCPPPPPSSPPTIKQVLLSSLLGVLLASSERRRLFCGVVFPALSLFLFLSPDNSCQTVQNNGMRHIPVLG